MFAKKTVSVFVALSFIFIAEAFAKKSRTNEDPSGQTKASQRLTRKADAQKIRQAKADQKSALKLKKQQQTPLKKPSKPDRNVQKQQQAQLKAKRKQSTPVPQPIASKPVPTPTTPKVFKEPTAYYVNVRDLSKDEKKQASKLIGIENLSNNGMIKFAHPALNDQNPTFQNFLNIKAQDKAQTGKQNAFETLEYRGSASSNTSAKDKKSNWQWPWSK